MVEKISRRPLRNFFIKKSLQIKMVLKIFSTVLASAILTLGILILVYNSKSHSGSFYYMSDNIMQDLELKSILGTVLPPILAVEIIGVCIAFGIGLFSSRKIAVPLYKIEKWAYRLRSGKLKAQLAFREEDRLDDITSQCNGVTEFFRETFLEIQEHVTTIDNNPDNALLVKERITALKQILECIDL